MASITNCPTDFDAWRGAQRVHDTHGLGVVRGVVGFEEDDVVDAGGEDAAELVLEGGGVDGRAVEAHGAVGVEAHEHLRVVGGLRRRRSLGLLRRRGQVELLDQQRRHHHEDDEEHEHDVDERRHVHLGRGPAAAPAAWAKGH